MVKAAVVHRDLKKICDSTNSIYFTFDELYKYDENKNTLYDMEAFEKKVKPLLGDDWKELLLARSIVLPDYNGNYTLNIDQYVDNGGVNYSSVGKNNINIFFGSNDKSFDGLYVLYHEAAHSLQKSQKLFAKEEMDKLYNFCLKGIKKNSNGRHAEKMIKKSVYSKYLNELHSEAFATSCMLLRAEGGIDYIKQVAKTYAEALYQSTAALFDTGKKYPSSKYYAGLPLCVAMIKRITKLKMNGQVKEKLADEQGKLDFLKLSREVETQVIKNAYSPLTFNRMLKYDIFKRPSKSTSQWWGLQSVYATSASAMLLPFNIRNSLKTRELRNRKKIGQDFISKKQHNRFIPLQGKDLQTRSINALCQVDNSLVRFGDVCRKRWMDPINAHNVVEVAGSFLRSYCLGDNRKSDRAEFLQEVIDNLPDNKARSFVKYFNHFMENNEKRIDSADGRNGLSFYNALVTISDGVEGRRAIWYQQEQMRKAEQKNGVGISPEYEKSKNKVGERIKMVKNLVINITKAVGEKIINDEQEKNSKRVINYKERE